MVSRSCRESGDEPSAAFSPVAGCCGCDAPASSGVPGAGAAEIRVDAAADTRGIKPVLPAGMASGGGGGIPPCGVPGEGGADRANIPEFRAGMLGCGVPFGAELLGRKPLVWAEMPGRKPLVWAEKAGRKPLVWAEKAGRKGLF